MLLFRYMFEILLRKINHNVIAVLELIIKPDNSGQTHICQSMFREDTQVLPYKSSP